jgi:hypothetical protein
MDEAKAEAERNPARLTLDPDHIVMALQLFHERKEQILVEMQVMGQDPRKKKVAFANEEEEAERQKKKQKMFWEKLTTVLSA